MEVLLLGTGGADGWPNPWCTCGSCTAMRARGELRAQTSALVDDVVLLDCGPEAPRSALRAGRTLAGVRSVLLTHAHPDHAAGPPLMWRRWTGTRAPLEVVGPPAALDVVRPYVADDDPVVLRPVDPWDEVVLAAGTGAGDVSDGGDGGRGYRARAVPAAHGGPEIGPAVLWDLTAPDGARLLYATDTAPLPAETLDRLAGADYDALLLECAFGDVPVPGQDHHGLETWPVTVEELRRRGAVGPGTRLVAVHLTDGNPAPPELDGRFAAWGATAPPDGTVLEVSARRAASTSPAGDPPPARP